MPNRLDGKVAIVTGGARGIGEGHAELFAAEGASVLIGDVLEADGEATAQRLREKGYNAIFQYLDVTDEASWGKAVETVVGRFGKLTTLINNAAIFNSAGLLATSRADWNKIIDVNLTGQFLGMQACMPALLETGNAAIVNICSLYGNIGSPGFTAYHASKGGVRIATKSVALEYARRGIRVNSVHPGNTDTPAQGNLSDEENAHILSLVPMGIIGKPIDIAYGSLYLASDEARYVTGAELMIDGGWSVP